VYDESDFHGETTLAIVWVLMASVFAALVFLVLWLRERRRAQIEYVAYGLRGDVDSDESTKTNITMMESSYQEALSKLEDLGQVKRDDRGNWIWVETGKQVGESATNDN
jgi:hypothetical protein